MSALSVISYSSHRGHSFQSECSLCGKLFASRKKLGQHTNAKHSEQPCHICHLCSKSFMNKSKLLRHIDFCSKAKKKKTNKCEVCNVVFGSRRSLARHSTKFHRDHAI